jgi:hypothetical protein
MSKNLFSLTAALGVVVLGFCATPALSAQARVGANANVGVNTPSPTVRTTTGSGFAERGPNVRPHGWSQGKKKGWGCTVGSANCKPPGLR